MSEHRGEALERPIGLASSAGGETVPLVPCLGGFRHPDTILVTDGEPEFLTDYPRDLESLTLPLG